MTTEEMTAARNALSYEVLVIMGQQEQAEQAKQQRLSEIRRLEAELNARAQEPSEKS